MVKRSSCSSKVQPIGGPDQDRSVSVSKAAELSFVFCFFFLHYVLINICLAVVGCCKRAQPGYRERMSKHNLQIHPSWLFGPSSLLLFQLLDTLRGWDITWHEKHVSLHIKECEHTENNHQKKGLKIKHIWHSFLFLQEALIWWLTLCFFPMSLNITQTDKRSTNRAENCNPY